MKKLVFSSILFLFGGSLYYAIELVARKYSHWSMFLAGGLCFLLIDLLNQRLKASVPLWVRCTFSALIITAVEFVAGCMVNLWAQWNVWDYSRFKFHFMGQVCLRYTLIWFFLSAPAIWLTTLLRKLYDSAAGFWLARIK